MSPKEALAVLDQIASVVQVNRQDHQNIQMALMVLTELVNKEEQPPKPEK
jgi:RNase P/RNase MRP subunit POP5